MSFFITNRNWCRKKYKLTIPVQKKAILLSKKMPKTEEILIIILKNIILMVICIKSFLPAYYEKYDIFHNKIYNFN